MLNRQFTSMLISDRWLEMLPEASSTITTTTTAKLSLKQETNKYSEKINVVIFSLNKQNIEINHNHLNLNLKQQNCEKIP